MVDPLVQGTLPLGVRSRVKNPDGSVSTVRTMSIGTDAGETLIPTVVGNRILPDAAAIDHYQRTNESFGTFGSVQDADAFAQYLHQRHARRLADENAWRRKPGPR